MVANILPAEPHLTPEVGSKHFFSEISHVAYQIKGSIEHHESKYSVLSTKSMVDRLCSDLNDTQGDLRG